MMFRITLLIKLTLVKEYIIGYTNIQTKNKQSGNKDISKECKLVRE